MSVTHIISWESDAPQWVADIVPLALTGRTSGVNLVKDFVSLLCNYGSETEDEPIDVPFGQQGHKLKVFVRGLRTSKENPQRAYLSQDFFHSAKDENIIEDNPEADIWADERHDAEVDNELRGNREEKLLRRFIFFRGHVFMTNRDLRGEQDKEQYFLLVEKYLNEQELNRRRLKARVERQRRLLANPISEGNWRARFDNDVIRFVYERDVVCQICGADQDLQIDHILPHSLGGGDSESNLRLLCGSCNRERGNLLNR